MGIGAAASTTLIRRITGMSGRGPGDGWAGDLGRTESSNSLIFPAAFVGTDWDPSPSMTRWRGALAAFLRMSESIYDNRVRAIRDKRDTPTAVRLQEEIHFAPQFSTYTSSMRCREVWEHFACTSGAGPSALGAKIGGPHRERDRVRVRAPMTFPECSTYSSAGCAGAGVTDGSASLSAFVL